MKLRRSLLLTGVPLAAGLTLASTALGAGSTPKVTVRVEGGMAQPGRDALLQFLRKDVLQTLRLGMELIPGHLE